jgi:uncharacterized protein (DUF1800 family)
MALDNERSNVAHLLRRAGFGFSESELDRYTALGYQGALEQLLNPESVDDSALAQQLAALQLDLNDPENRRKIEPAKLLWFNRMLYTRRPLQEKMTLFWHNHFATANSKVGNAIHMLRQIDLFREHALGNFETLLQKVTRDPAMLIWLDNRQNRKSSPNENFAREVMELFTVGIGNYSEQDIKEAARAFTGYTLDRDQKFVFQANQHDTGRKTFMGETKNWDADGVLATLVRHPATARFLSTKLFKFFVHDAPESATIDRLANTFTTSGFDIRALVRDLFSGPEFLSSQAFHGLVKQPVDYVAGALKALEVNNFGPDITATMRRMGQDLLNPPDVSGWAGGSAWISSTTLFERFNFANKLATARDATKPYFTDIPGRVAARGVASSDMLVDYFVGLLVDGDLTPEARQALLSYVDGQNPIALDNANSVDLKARGLVHLAMSVPSYQLA